ncbi:M48 family metallopeptidase [Kaistia terrae]|uniref:M48 family metallopeptidase n=1 Tax=Kaistia terrae TaxID=537017 RepID=A0ABW0Q977_9HYPH
MSPSDDGRDESDDSSTHECGGYVVTHELCHIAVPHLGPEFFELLDRVFPDWEKRKHRLEQIMA